MRLSTRCHRCLVLTYCQARGPLHLSSEYLSRTWRHILVQQLLTQCRMSWCLLVVIAFTILVCKPHSKRHLLCQLRCVDCASACRAKRRCIKPRERWSRRSLRDIKIRLLVRHSMLNPWILSWPVLAIGSDWLNLATATLLSYRSLLLCCHRLLLILCLLESTTCVSFYFALDILFTLYDGLTSLSRSETVVWVDLFCRTSISFWWTSTYVYHWLGWYWIFSILFVFLQQYKWIKLD